MKSDRRDLSQPHLPQNARRPPLPRLRPPAEKSKLVTVVVRRHPRLEVEAPCCLEEAPMEDSRIYRPTRS
jgi:hypothetical protein